MAREMVTEYETVETNVEMVVCDECGKDIGPEDDEETTPIPVLANPQFEYDISGVGREYYEQLREHQWVQEERDDGEAVIVEVPPLFLPEGPWFVPADAAKDAFKEAFPSKEDVVGINADAIRELCRGCAADEGFTVNDAGEVQPLSVQTAEEPADGDVDGDATADENPTTTWHKGFQSAMLLIMAVGTTVFVLGYTTALIPPAFGIGLAVAALLFGVASDIAHGEPLDPADLWGGHDG